jgi:hypothetical protein
MYRDHGGCYPCHGRCRSPFAIPDGDIQGVRPGDRRIVASSHRRMFHGRINIRAHSRIRPSPSTSSRSSTMTSRFTKLRAEVYHKSARPSSLHNESLGPSDDHCPQRGYGLTWTTPRTEKEDDAARLRGMRSGRRTEREVEPIMLRDTGRWAAAGKAEREQIVSREQYPNGRGKSRAGNGQLSVQTSQWRWGSRDICTRFHELSKISVDGFQ